jgi:hypothetical protein
MTNEQTLNQAIEKAVKNGYFWHISPTPHVYFDDEELIWRYKHSNEYYANAIDVIFSHRFAKAFWGEADEESKLPPGSSISLSPSTGPYEFKRAGWQYHLQQMVLEENPIKYLERFL